MKTNDIFTFIAPNGVEVTAIVLDKQLIENSIFFTIYQYTCYAQNRLFYYTERYFPDVDKTELKEGKVIADYAILPKYDTILENYQHQIDMANDYADKTL